MVYFKVTDGGTTRRFQMKAGQHSYDHLKDRLAALFPEAMKTADNLHLHYTDSDGDQITISTDTEFQEALAELPAEAVWKLHIRPQRKERTTLPPNRSTAGPHRCSSHPFPTPVRRLGAPRCSPWFPLSHPLSPAHSSLWGFPSWSILDTGFEDLIHQHTHLLLEALGKETRDDAAQKQGASGEAASNEDQSEKENEEGKSKVATATDSTVPGLQVKNFGSWEPRECEGQFGRGTVTGPVGYYASWTSGTSKEQENSKSKKEEGSTEEKTAGDEDVSGHTQENNMETEGEKIVGEQENNVETEGEKTAGDEDVSGHTQENNMETEGEKTAGGEDVSGHTQENNMETEGEKIAGEQENNVETEGENDSS